MAVNVPRLTSLRRQLKNPRPFLELLGAQFVALVNQRFNATKTDPYGRAWAPWASSTATARRRAGNSSLGLLVVTGQLRDLTKYTVKGNVLSVTNSSRIAGLLQDGTRRMPGRAFVGYGQQERKTAADMWSQWINSQR